MKKILCLLLSVLIVFMFASCSDKKNDGEVSVPDGESTDVDVNITAGDSERGDVPTHIQNNSGAEEASSSGESSENTVTSELSLSCDSTTVNAGDTVTVVMNFSDCAYVTSLDVFVEADKGLTYEDGSVFSIPDFSMEISETSDQGYSVCRVAGFTMYTKDFENTDICELTYKIPSTAKSGDSFSITVNPYDVQVGTDKMGATLLRITDDIVVNNIMFTVK